MKKTFKKFKKKHFEFFQKISQTITGLAIILAITLIANAFTEPASAPPGGNVSAPLNTSATTQTKTGRLNFPWFEDTDAANYFVDPSGNSNLWRLYVYSTDVFSAYFAGNVGIGTTTPGAKLEVVGDIRLTGADPVILRADGAVNTNLALYANGSMIFNIDRNNDATGEGFYFRKDVGTDLVSILESGSVGIGTAIPTQKLDVAGNVKGTGLCIGADCRTSWPSGINVYSCPVKWVASFDQSTCVGQLSANPTCTYSASQGPWPSLPCTPVGKLIQ